jgi:transcription-repair coupling factor (superfamily II helicase)
MYIPNSFFHKSPLFELIRMVDEGKTPLRVKGLWGASLSFLAWAIHSRLSSPLLLLAPDEDEAEAICDEISIFSNEEPLLFPAWDVLPYEDMKPDEEILNDRLSVLEALSKEGRSPLIVACYKSVAKRVISPSFMRRVNKRIAVGMEISMEDFIQELSRYGYERTSTVFKHGQFARRGGIIDIYPSSMENPVRIEFFGDVVESIRDFDPLTQRSTKMRDEVVIPLRMDSLEGAETSTIFDYLPEEAVLILSDARMFRERAFEFDEQVFEKGRLAGIKDPDRTMMGSGYVGSQEVFSLLRRRRLILSSGSPKDIPEIPAEEEIHIELKPVVDYHGQIPIFREDLLRWIREGFGVLISCEDEGQMGRIAESLGPSISPILDAKSLPNPGEAAMVVGRARMGFLFPELSLVFVSDQDIFGRYRRRRPAKLPWRPSTEIAISRISELKPNDYVVHVVHGIGRFLGIERIEVEGRGMDFLAIEYDMGDKLYVPVDQFDLIHKYVGQEGYTPKLSRLGTELWRKTKERVKRSVGELAKELLSIYAEREAYPGYAFSPDSEYQKEFEESFAYEETPDQIRAVEEIKADMESQRPMDRLICGDVGFGKTEVAMRAAFKAVMDGKQVMVLVPTTVLAQQHYNTFRERMAKYPIFIEMLSRLRSPKEQKMIIEGLRKGTVDIVIGTHRLLSKDISFRDLGLVIIDEEHRFGVRQKEMLKKLRRRVDVISMSATPIPRTLYLSLSGIRDISIIRTPPPSRLPIRTFVQPFEEGLVREAILREMSRGGQVFFVHNRVQSIYKVARFLSSLVPEARIGVVHGQMPEEEIEEVMRRFVAGDYDVLVCTSIIGSGIDIPNANTIIIDRADTFGLADLYQLRGRVGRGRYRAYAYLLYPREIKLTEEARRRLEAISDFGDLGAGLSLAMRDMEIRGVGNILGPEQHGHMLAVGYEMYQRLLKRAIKELKGEMAEEEEGRKVEINLKVDAYLPSDYIGDEFQRLVLYRRMASVSDVKELEELMEELRDRFGPLPPQALRLIKIIGIKCTAKDMGIERIEMADGRVFVEFSPEAEIPVDRILAMVEDFGSRMVFSPKRDRLFGISVGSVDDDSLISFVEEVLSRIRPWKDTSSS